MYASDASLYQIAPMAVVRPRHADDVAGCIKYAVENGLPVFPRGGGTGLAGQSLGPGIVLDFSRFMRRMIHIDREKLVVRVQPGMALADMNRALAKDRLVFGPDPPTRAVTTIGSVLAIDTLGSHFLRYGTAGGTLVSAQCVLADGQQVLLEKSPWRAPTSSNTKFNHLVSEVGQLCWANRAIIKSPPWRGVARGCGYRLEASCDHDTVDMAKMARYAFEFCAVESCGKCTPCRIGSTRGVEVMDKIIAKEDHAQNITLVRDLSDTMLNGSLCALGGMTPYPVLSAMNHFPEDFGLEKGQAA
jgi:hypothetical protein